MRSRFALAAGLTLCMPAAVGCDWTLNTNVPDSEGAGTDDGGEWRTFFVGDAHVYDPACGLQNFAYCIEPYACDADGADISNKLQSLNWDGVISSNDLHEYRMWKDFAAPPNDGLDYLFADKYTVAWYLGHGNIGYLAFSEPHAGDPWSNPCLPVFRWALDTRRPRVMSWQEVLLLCL